MTLYFLRHGDAVENSSLQDRDRPLSELGRQQAAMAGRYLRNLQPTVDLILCSPLLRTRQTAETVQTEVGNVSVFTAESLVSSANPLELLKDLCTRSTEVILLVGHEPHLSKTISLLI